MFYKQRSLSITHFKPNVRIRLIYEDNQLIFATMANNIIRERFNRFSIGSELINKYDKCAFSKIYAEEFFRKYLNIRCCGADGSNSFLPINSSELEHTPFSELFLKTFIKPRYFVMGFRTLRLAESSAKGFRPVRSVSSFNRGIIMSLGWLHSYTDTYTCKLLLSTLITHQLGQLFVPGICSYYDCVRAYDISSENYSAKFPDWFCTNCISALMRIKQNH